MFPPHTHMHKSEVFFTLEMTMKDGFRGRNEKTLGTKLCSGIIQTWTMVVVEGIDSGQVQDLFRSYIDKSLVID